jgi:nucleotide-binding universal stress UspA family protein
LRGLVGKQTRIETEADEFPLAPGVKRLTGNGDAGLVVMGITGKSDLEQILIGSHTLDLAKDSHTPLLIVPGSARFEKIRRIVFACDLEIAPDAIPVPAIRTLAQRLGARLVILNVGHEPAGQPVAEAFSGSEPPEYHQVARRDIAKGIMEFAGHHDIQLVITIPQKYGFFESLFHRSVTKKLAFHTHLPLLHLNEAI